MSTDENRNEQVEDVQETAEAAAGEGPEVQAEARGGLLLVPRAAIHLGTQVCP